MSSSDKLRLAGQQPSHRGGVLRMRTWRNRWFRKRGLDTEPLTEEGS